MKGTVLILISTLCGALSYVFGQQLSHVANKRTYLSVIWIAYLLGFLLFRGLALGHHEEVLGFYKSMTPHKRYIVAGTVIPIVLYGFFVSFGFVELQNGVLIELLELSGTLWVGILSYLLFRDVHITKEMIIWGICIMIGVGIITLWSK